MRDRDETVLAVVEAGLAAVVVLAPLPFGAVRGWGRDALEWTAFALLAIAVFGLRPRVGALPSKALLAASLGLLAVGAVQIAPLPGAAAAALSPETARVRAATVPPAEAAAEEARLLGVPPAELDPAPRLSVSPRSSAAALRTGAAALALAISACAVAARRPPWWFGPAALVSAGFQALYGLLVLASRHDRIWNVPKTHYLDCATGTFINRNHFASFLAMALAVGVAALLAAGHRARRHAPTATPFSWTDAHGIALLAGAGLAVLGLAGLLLSFSRAGTALGGGAILWVMLLGAPLVTRRRWALAAGTALIAAIPLAALGFARLAGRYGEAFADLSTPGGRMDVWIDTVRMAAAFPVAGTGFGTFGEIYPSFRSPAVRLFYDHAHNDWLQAVAEGGIVAAALLIVGVAAIAPRLVRGLAGRYGTAAIGLAAAVVVAALHALVDFPMRIPALAAFVAVALGVLEGEACRQR